MQDSDSFLSGITPQKRMDTPGVFSPPQYRDCRAELRQGANPSLLVPALHHSYIFKSFSLLIVSTVWGLRSLARTANSLPKLAKQVDRSEVRDFGISSQYEKAFG